MPAKLWRFLLPLLLLAAALLGQTQNTQANRFYPPRWQLGRMLVPTPNGWDLQLTSVWYAPNRPAAYLLKNTQGFKLKVKQEYDSKSQTMRIQPFLLNDIPLGPALSVDADVFAGNIFGSVFEEKFFDKIRRSIQEAERERQGQGLFGEFELNLPANAIPKFARGFMGTKAGRLNLDGSQKLTISGKSVSNKNNRVNLSDSEDFSFTMRQDLNLILQGTIGEKIHVNVTHRSSNESDISNPNKIEIEYKGDEDEIVQSIKGGDINLALSGSHYIGYSASSEGLFGVKGEFKVGNLDVTTIVSQEEGQKNSQKYNGNSAADSTLYYSDDYDKNYFFYVVNPYNVYSLSTQTTPAGYAGNAIEIADSKWQITASGYNMLPREGSLKVYLDDKNATNNTTTLTVTGREWLKPGTNIHHSGNFEFEILEPDTDYIIDYDTGLISFKSNRSIANNYVLGVTYTENSGSIIGNSDQSDLQVKIIKASNDVYVDRGTTDYNDWYTTWDYKARNVYRLKTQNIKNEGFEVTIYTLAAGDVVSYNVDTTIASATTYNDYLRLDTNGNGYINGEDSSIDLAAGYIFLPFIRPFAAFSDNIIYSNENISTSSDDYDNINAIIKVNGKIGRDEIDLNQMNILKGSVRVRVNGETLTENTDYIVDYDFGTIMFLTAKGKDPEANVTVDYEYKPLFAIQSKTLVGVRADYRFNKNTRLGGTFIYHSEKVNEERPRVGNENKTLFLADIDGEVKYSPPFMTKMVDWLPLIQTDTDSEISLSGEVAASYPKLTGGGRNNEEVYVDDMESALESYPLGTSWKSWSPASKPYSTGLAKARVNWINDDDTWLARDVYNNLSTDEGKEKVNVLAFKMTPAEINVPGLATPTWGGLQKYLGNELDFSTKKYIELLVRVDGDSLSVPEVTMHVNLGNVSEDFYTDFGGSGVLNSEDGVSYNDTDGEPQETSLDGTFAAKKDVGLDMHIDNTSGDDPTDNATTSNNPTIDTPGINGTERNGELDTEDLNGDGDLNTLERYLQYSINLKDASYESISSKGWRLYRIPLKDNPNYQNITNANSLAELKRISYARVWFEASRTTRIDIAALDIVGNKWVERHIKEYEDQNLTDEEEELLRVAVVDNKKDSDHYTPPPDTYTTKDDIQSQEQAIAVDFYNLYPGHYGLVRNRLLDSVNLLAYNKMRFWVYAELFANSADNFTEQDQEIMVRFGADSLNYYEIRYPISPNQNLPGARMQQNNWHEIEVDFNELTKLKVEESTSPNTQDISFTNPNSSSPYNVTETWYELYKTNRQGDRQKYRYRMVHQPGQMPTLSAIREINLGVIVPDSTGFAPFNGRAYFNDIRVAEPYSDLGIAMRSAFTAKFADFSDFSANLDYQTPNFQTIRARSRNSTTSYQTSTNLSMRNNYRLGKFFPTSWGIDFPVGLTYTNNKSEPLFQSNSDIKRDNLTEKQKERERNTTLEHSITSSIRQTKAPSSPWLKYTVSSMAVNGSYKNSIVHNSSKRDTISTVSLGGSYNLNLPKEQLSVEIWPSLFGNYKYSWFPQEFQNSIDWQYKHPHSYRWDTSADSNGGWIPQEQSNRTKTFKIDNTINYDLLTDMRLTYELSTKRDQTRRDSLGYYKKLFGVNIGMETERNQNITATYNPNYTDRLFTISTNGNVRYTDQHRLLNQDTNTYRYEGNVSRSLTFNSTLKNKDLLNELADWVFPETGSLRGPEMNNEGFEQPGDDGSGKDGKDGKNGVDKDGKIENPSNNFSNPASHAKDEKSNSSFTPTSADKFGNMDLGGLPAKIANPDEPQKTEDKQAKEDGQKNIDKDKSESDKKKQSGPMFRYNPLAYAMRFIARIENFNMTYSNQYGTRFSDRIDRPNFAYQLGLPHSLEKQGQNEQDVIDSKTVTDTYTITSGLPILSNLSSQLGYTRNITRTYASSSSKTVSTTFPDIQTSLSGLEDWLPFGEALKSSRLSSTYRFIEDQRGTISWNNPDWTQPTEIVETTNFQPLVSWSASWAYDISSDFSYNWRKALTRTFNESSLRGVVDDRTQSMSGRLSWRYSSTSGFKIPFMSKRIRFENDLTSELNFSYERRKAIRNQTGSTTQIDSDYYSYSISPGLSYDFSRNIKGSINSQFKKTIQVQEEESIREFSLSMSVEIMF